MTSEPFQLINGNNSAGSLTLVCQDLSGISSRGVWLNRNPLTFSVPLFLLQLSIISLSSILIGLCLHPLKQPSIVTQIIGGIILGPSVLGHIKAFAAELFPMRGTMVIETFASFGLMFFFFIMGVKMDPKMMLKPGRISLIIGLSAVVSTLALTIPLTIILRKYISMDKTLAKSLPYIAASQTLTAFPNIACLLTELKLLNSELGRLALKTSMFGDMLGLIVTAFCFLVLGSTHIRIVFSLLSLIGFGVIIFCIFRPTILWMQKHKAEEILTGETCISVIFTIVLIAGLGSDILGQHYAIGSMMIGLAVPDGPPLGAALVAKLDCVVSWVLYPTFLTVSGLQTNIFEVHFRSTVIVLLVVVFATLVKIGAVSLAGYFTNVPFRDAIVLGLLLNTRGVCELAIFKFLHDSQVLGVQEFTLAVLSVLAVTIIITPLIRTLYDPHGHQTPVTKRTIQQAKPGTELRILLCIHNQDNVPSMVDLLEVSNATETGPISVTALILVELVGRTTPMLIAHNPQPVIDTLHVSTNSTSCHITNALHKYELENNGHVSVQSFSAISPFNMMHEDICRMALDQNATIIILPFHKIWAIDESIESIGTVHRAIHNINIKVLNEASCSVGIFIDRSILRGTFSTFRVLVLYIGGHDDVESLCYGVRMATHKNVTLTVIRFLLIGYERTRQHKSETNLINKIRNDNEENESFFYREQVVRDGVGLSACIGGLQDCFELIIAGRHHQEAALLHGLEAWSECPELGPVGDMLASPDFGKRASVLVVQQQRIGGKLVNRGSKSVIVNDRDISMPSRPSNTTEWSSSTVQ